MKKCFVLSLLLLAAVRCGRTGPSAVITVAGPVLPDGERTEYLILSAGRETGTLTMTVRHDTAEGIPLYRFDVVGRTRDGAVETTDSSVVFATRDSMRPLTTFRFIKDSATVAATAANYGDSAVAVSAWVQGSEQQRFLPAGPEAYDIDQLNILGRVVQIHGRGPAELTIVSPMGPPAGGSVVRAGLARAGDETVRVPAGSSRCYKLVLTIGQDSITLWYEKVGTHRMVRYLTADGEIEMVLATAAP
jgi:hypothetical protein